MKMWIPYQNPLQPVGSQPAAASGATDRTACRRGTGIAQRNPVHSNVQLWEWCERGRR